MPVLADWRWRPLLEKPPYRRRPEDNPIHRNHSDPNVQEAWCEVVSERAYGPPALSITT